MNEMIRGQWDVVCWIRRLIRQRPRVYKALSSIIAVVSSSSFMSALPSIAFIAFFADLTMVTRTPPKCGASGGLKF